MFISLLALAVAAAEASSSSLGRLDPQDVVRSMCGQTRPPQLVVYATGGAAHLAPLLLATPGASKAVLEIQYPYSRDSLIDILGSEPTSYASQEVACSMASAAFDRARQLSEDADLPAVGLGCTAALRSEPEKMGEHRCYVAVRTHEGTHTVGLTLAKGARSRGLEDVVVSRLALATLARACNIDGMPEPADALHFWQLPPDVDGEVLDAEPLEYRFDRSD